jgi:hypothetical protein
VSTATNPYSAQLGERNAREVIAETPGRLAQIVNRIGNDGLHRSWAPGKWSARQILCHLADCGVVFAFRLRQALAEPYHVIQPFDQDAWSKSYAELDGRAALETFSALRRWNLALLETVREEDFGKKLTHPERGEMTFQTVIETMAGHDLNHLKQLGALGE